MANKDDLIVGGYFFGSYEDAKQAHKEMKNAQYLNERAGTLNGKQLKALYDKMLDEKVFSTPVGWEYLKYLRNCMEESGIDMNGVRPIPLYIKFSEEKDDRDYSHIAKMYVKPAKGEITRLKERNRLSTILNVIFVILIIAMFVITMNSSSPNIINYKTAITNQYSAWEQELNEREQALKEREAKVENSDS